MWNTFSASHFGKSFTPLDALHYFYCEKGNNKLEIKEQEKEEMVLFSIEILWKRTLCLSFGVMDEGEKNFAFSNCSMKWLFLSDRFCWVQKRSKRGMRNSLFSLWTGLLLFLFNLVLNTIHMCIIAFFLLIPSFVNLWSISTNKSEKHFFFLACLFPRLLAYLLAICQFVFNH